MSDLPDPTLSTALLRTALSHIDDVLLITEAGPFDRPGPRVIYVNDAFTKMTGYTLEEVYGKTPRILQGPETSGEARAKIRAALERWEPVRVELTNYRKDGTTFEVDLSIQPIWEGERVTHWVAVQRDVTEARAAARRRIHEDRLRSLGMLSGSIAHDFNNILHALGVMLELMEGEEDPEQLAQLHEDVRYALKRGDDMATRLLAFSRPERGEVEEVDLAEVLERTLDLCLKGGDTTRTVKTPSDPVRVMADPTQVSQVFMNLALNARQAMSDAGHLEVTARRIEGGKVQVCFEDDGPGFAPEQLEAAFEPFHTTRAAGTGLGLSIVHGIVTHLGGEVTLGNAPGGGARICTTWEVAEDDGPSKPPHVLVVEDDALNRKLTMRLLGVLGYTSEGTETAEQALERIETSAFDMALIDINLGSGMKGSELASRLVASNAIEQVVFMSANHDLAEGLKNISPHFLSKPFTRSQLNEMMKSCVAG